MQFISIRAAFLLHFNARHYVWLQLPSFKEEGGDLMKGRNTCFGADITMHLFSCLVHDWTEFSRFLDKSFQVIGQVRSCTIFRVYASNNGEKQVVIKIRFHFFFTQVSQGLLYAVHRQVRNTIFLHFNGCWSVSSSKKGLASHLSRYEPLKKKWKIRLKSIHCRKNSIVKTWNNRF